MLFVQSAVDSCNLPQDAGTLFHDAGGGFFLKLLGAHHFSPYIGHGPAAPVVETVTTAFLKHALAGTSSDPVLSKLVRSPGIATLYPPSATPALVDLPQPDQAERVADCAVPGRTAMRPVQLVGDDLEVPCVDGISRPYLSLDSAASTAALPSVADRVAEFLPWYSSIHRGAGYKSQAATAAYEQARESILAFAGRSGPDDLAIICRNTTEAINHLSYRLDLSASDVVVTSVVEHHANLLPWARVAGRRFVECGTEGTFTLEAVAEALGSRPAPRLLAITGASNVTGWLPPVNQIIDAAHALGVPVLVDGAQLAAHGPLPKGAEFLVFSGHKMYAPFGAGVLIGPRRAFEQGDPFLAGGGAVELVDLDEVVWTEPPEREEAGSPNVVGAVALGAAVVELDAIGWPAIVEHDLALSEALQAGLRRTPGVRVLGPARHASPPPGTGAQLGEPANLRPEAQRSSRGLFRRGRCPARARRRPPERRIRHRRPPRVLLRPPVPGSPARPRSGRHRELQGGCAAR